MLKGNLFDLKMAAGDSSDTRAGGGEGQSHPLESAKWIEKSSPKISLWKIKWKVVWIELEHISCAKWRGWGREALVRRWCSQWHVSRGRKSSEHMEGSAGYCLPVCQPGPVFFCVCSCPSEQLLPYCTDVVRREKGQRNASRIERDKEGKGKRAKAREKDVEQK